MGTAAARAVVMVVDWVAEREEAQAVVREAARAAG